MPQHAFLSPPPELPFHTIATRALSSLRRLRRCATAGVATALLVSAPAAAQNVDANLWGTNGAVKAIAEADGTIYVGGNLTTWVR